MHGQQNIKILELCNITSVKQPSRIPGTLHPQFTRHSKTTNFETITKQPNTLIRQYTFYIII